jgi:protein TonB
MPYRAEPTRSDRAKAIASVAAIYAAMIAAMMLVRTDTSPPTVESTPPTLIEIREPPPPPPPEPQTGKAKEEEGAVGKKAEPTPIVVPTPKIVVPANPPVAAAPIAGTGLSPNAGAANAGTGPGAGGSGTGRGGGGSGGGGGIGSEARLLGGNSAKLPRWMLRQFAADRGYGFLWLTISESGRVTDCNVLQSAGSPEVDQALCNLMLQRSRWAPARDKQGNPIAVKLRYTATWSKD